MNTNPERNSPGNLEHVTLLGAALNAVKLNVPKFDIIFSDFPRIDELQEISDVQRYPLNLYVEMTDYLETLYGYGAMLKLGRDVGKAVVEVSMAQMEIRNLSEAIAALQHAHEYFCNPTLGAFSIVDKQPDSMLISYTAPYNCKLQEGLLAVIARRYGYENALVSHPECRRKGAPACLYRISYTEPELT